MQESRVFYSVWSAVTSHDLPIIPKLEYWALPVQLGARKIKLAYEMPRAREVHTSILPFIHVTRQQAVLYNNKMDPDLPFQAMLSFFAKTSLPWIVPQLWSQNT